MLKLFTELSDRFFKYRTDVINKTGDHNQDLIHKKSLLKNVIFNIEDKDLRNKLLDIVEDIKLMEYVSVKED